MGAAVAVWGGLPASCFSPLTAWLPDAGSTNRVPTTLRCREAGPGWPAACTPWAASRRRCPLPSAAVPPPPPPPPLPLQRQAAVPSPPWPGRCACPCIDSPLVCLPASRQGPSCRCRHRFPALLPACLPGMPPRCNAHCSELKRAPSPTHPLRLPCLPASMRRRCTLALLL